MVLALAAALIALDPARAMQQAPPRVRVHDCTSGGCHADVTGFEFLHGPVAVGACETCHAYADEAAHRFILKRSGAEMCSFCHIGPAAEAGLMVVHEPVQKGECLACHNPHGSVSRLMLRGATSGEICLSCHPAVSQGRAHVHTPVGRGECTSCHQAHASSHADLLVAPQRELCLRCHAQVLATAAAPAAGEGLVPMLHAPILEGCSGCHDAHASDHAGILLQAPGELCASCHQPIAQAAAAAAVSHSAVTGERACLNCHAPHHSPVANLLRGEPTATCMACHGRDVQRADGTVVAGLTELAHATFRHGPVAEGRCDACHQVHGGSHRALLTQPYSGAFYQAFDPESYALCFQCHDSQLALESHTTTATRFRNGDLNLHRVHVTDPRLGRNCRVCHATHAGESAALMRRDVLFGQWRIPIDFEPTETGGACAAGCHRGRRYDRETPVPPPPPVGQAGGPGAAAP
jgi:predicted CXXCH cytochrome family protein